MPLPAIGDAPAIKRPICPRCNSHLIPVRNRFVDRLLSLFAPVQRYRCGGRHEDPGCAWVGKLRASHDQAKKTNETVFGDMSFGDMAQITLNAIGDAVLVVEPEGTVIYVNRVAETLSGWPSAEAIGRPVEEVFRIVDGRTRERADSPSKQAISEGRIVELALGSVLLRKDGTDLAIEDSAAPIHNRQGRIVGGVIVFHDARQSRTMTEKMSYAAYHDAITSLPNRVLLMEHLTQAIAMARRHDKQLAVLFLDIDNFKQVNDSFGHACGDSVLRTVAMEIEACIRDTDTVCRFGGDEFVVLLSQIEAMEDAAQVATKLLSRFAVPRVINGGELPLTLSIGISTYPASGLDAAALIHNADLAMYSAKSGGRNGYRMYHRVQ